jgi:Flp pilus assembly protein TadB
MEDMGIIIAIVGSSIAIVGVVLAMMFWMRQEANALRHEAKEDRKDLLQISRNIEMEMKDFHYKLLEIERFRK